MLGSQFVQEWLGLLRDPDLAAACERAGVRLGFLPHPNLQRLLPQLDLPDHVLPLSYEGTDVQELFARARVLVTDYSSIAFNAAYLERPVVYFQFDAAEVLAGAHVGRPGYFEYERDGFGPVTRRAAATVAAIRQALEHGGAPLPDYLKRIEETFPHRDGGCSERVVQAVLAASRRDHDAAPVPTPPAPRGSALSPPERCQRPRLTVAVGGSCVTRDNFNSTFNPDWKSWFQVVAERQPDLDDRADVTAHRGGVAAAAGDERLRPEEHRRRPDRGSSSGDVAEQQPRYLILDWFGDVHFGVARLPDGRYFTENRWKVMHTDFYRDLPRGRRADQAEPRRRRRRATSPSGPRRSTGSPR